MGETTTQLLRSICLPRLFIYCRTQENVESNIKSFSRSFLRNTQKTTQNTEKKKFGFLMAILLALLAWKISFLTYILHSSYGLVTRYRGKSIIFKKFDASFITYGILYKQSKIIQQTMK